MLGRFNMNDAKVLSFLCSHMSTWVKRSLQKMRQQSTQWSLYHMLQLVVLWCIPWLLQDQTLHKQWELLAGSWPILARYIGKSSSQLWDIWEGQKVTVSVMERFLWNYMDSMTDMVTGDMDTHKSTSKYVFTLSGFPDCRWLLHYLCFAWTFTIILVPWALNNSKHYSMTYVWVGTLHKLHCLEEHKMIYQNVILFFIAIILMGI